MRAGRRRGERGITLVFAILIMLLVAVLSVAIINYAGADRIAAARLSVQERGVACADAGIQYGRRYFGCNYKRTGNWNAILGAADGAGLAAGRYDPSRLDVYPTRLSDVGSAFKGDIDGDGVIDYWVSIRDDDDERPLAADPSAGDDRKRDNNLAVILRSECINPAYAVEVGGERKTAVVEVLLVYLPNTTTPYGKATSSSDFPEASSTGPTVVSYSPEAMATAICDEE